MSANQEMFNKLGLGRSYADDDDADDSADEDEVANHLNTTEVGADANCADEPLCKLCRCYKDGPIDSYVRDCWISCSGEQLPCAKQWEGVVASHIVISQRRTTLGGGMFSEVSTGTLEISNNGALTEIQAGLLDGITIFQRFVITNNPKLTFIEPGLYGNGALVDTPIIEITLNSELSTLKSGLFSGLSGKGGGLQIRITRNNKLTKLEAGLFSGIKTKVSSISISGNEGLKELKSGLFEGAHKISENGIKETLVYTNVVLSGNSNLRLIQTGALNGLFAHRLMLYNNHPNMIIEPHYYEGTNAKTEWISSWDVKIKQAPCCNMEWLLKMPLDRDSFLICGSPEKFKNVDLTIDTEDVWDRQHVRNGGKICNCLDAKLPFLKALSDGEENCVASCGDAYAKRTNATTNNICDACRFHHDGASAKDVNPDTNCKVCATGPSVGRPSNCKICTNSSFLKPKEGCVSDCSMDTKSNIHFGFRNEKNGGEASGEGWTCESCIDKNCNTCPNDADICTECTNRYHLHDGVCVEECPSKLKPKTCNNPTTLRDKSNKDEDYLWRFVPTGENKSASNNILTGSVCKESVAEDSVKPSSSLQLSPNITHTRDSSLLLTVTFEDQQSAAVAGLAPDFSDIVFTPEGRAQPADNVGRVFAKGAFLQVNFNPNQQGKVTINLPANVSADESCNTNTAATPISIVYDTDQPAIDIASFSNDGGLVDTIEIKIVDALSPIVLDAAELCTFVKLQPLGRDDVVPTISVGSTPCTLDATTATCTFRANHPADRSIPVPYRFQLNPKAAADAAGNESPLLVSEPLHCRGVKLGVNGKCIQFHVGVNKAKIAKVDDYNFTVVNPLTFDLQFSKERTKTDPEKFTDPLEMKDTYYAVGDTYQIAPFTVLNTTTFASVGANLDTLRYALNGTLPDSLFVKTSTGDILVTFTAEDENQTYSVVLEVADGADHATLETMTLRVNNQIVLADGNCTHCFAGSLPNKDQNECIVQECSLLEGANVCICDVLQPTNEVEGSVSLACNGAAFEQTKVNLPGDIAQLNFSGVKPSSLSQVITDAVQQSKIDAIIMNPGAFSGSGASLTSGIFSPSMNETFVVSKASASASRSITALSECAEVVPAAAMDVKRNADSVPRVDGTESLEGDSGCCSRTFTYLGSFTKKCKFHDHDPVDFMTMVKIIVSFTQVKSLLVEVYPGAPWPNSYRSATRALQFMSSNPLSVMMPSCLSSALVISSYSEMVMASLAPLVLAPLIWAYYMIRSRWCKNAIQLQAVCISTASFAFYLLYPTITVSAVRIMVECDIVCTDEDETDNCISHLPSDYSITCGTGEEQFHEYSSTHKIYRALATVSFVFYAIIVPVILVVNLYRMKKRTTSARWDAMYNKHIVEDQESNPGDQQVIQPTSSDARIDTNVNAFLAGLYFFGAPYRKGFYLWEFVDLFRKLLLVSIIVFVADGTSLQLAVGAIFAVGGLVLQLMYKPFAHPSENALAAVSQTILAIVLIVGGLLRASEAEVAALMKTGDVDSFVAGAYMITSGIFLYIVAFVVWFGNPLACLCHKKEPDNNLPKLGAIESNSHFTAISETQFETTMLPKTRRATSLFALIDLNDDGKVSKKELADELNTPGSELAAVLEDAGINSAVYVLEQMDADGDGNVDIKEFKAAIHTSTSETAELERNQHIDGFDSDDGLEL
eukprot:gene10749-21976_t